MHRLLQDLDRGWAAAAPYGAYGVRQRFVRAVDSIRADWPVRSTVARVRLGELTIAWPPEGT